MLTTPTTTVRRAASQCILLTVILGSALVAVRGQTTAATLGHTPSGVTPGSPAGSYTLSGFDTVNPYNGGLNFNLPLMDAGGRGTASYTIPVQVEQKWTAFHDVIIDPQTSQQWDFWWPEYNWWTGLKPGYSPGVLQGRQAGVGSQSCTWTHTWFTYYQTLTRLTFTTPDGTEYELRDQLTGGQRATVPPCTPLDTPGAARGTVFVTADGSAATFISDTTIHDSISSGAPGLIYPSGYLMLRDGTRFRIDDGAVTWMRDRNGNQLTFAAAVGTMTITDSLNRQIFIEYDVQDIAPYGLCDRITFKGFGGASRVIRVSKTNLGNVLRSGFTLQSPIALFPELFSGSSGPHNPTVISAVWLPNGQSYKLFYNDYGELARVELPTGGAFEYDWAAGATGGPTSGVICPLSYDPHIYRRVIVRRVYPNGGSGPNFESRMTFSRPESGTSNCPSSNDGYVEVSQFSNGETLLSLTRHYYFGSPTSSLINSYDPTSYPAWDEGKEYQTEMFAADGTTVLRQTVNTWMGNGTMGGLTVNPRIVETTTALEPTGANLVTKKSFAHDQYNNQTDVYEYDFGSGGPGSLARRRHIDYLTTNPVNGVNYATTNTIHARSLATQQSVFDAAGVEKARTTFEYDNYNSDANHAALVNRSMISGLDGSFTTSYTTRGNVTSASAWLLPAGSSIPVYSQYDIAGNVVKTIDGRGNPTQFDFTDRFGAPDGEARLNAAPLELSSQGQASYAFPTKVTNALGHIGYAQFDYYLGRPVDSEDANQINFSGYFNDNLDRPTRVISAVNNPTVKAQATFSYDDTNRIVTSTSDLNSYDDNLLKSQTLYDGLSRTIETRQYEGGTNFIAQKQIPFVMQQDPDTGAWLRATQSSNPYRPYLSEQPVWTTTFFDALDRSIKVRTPDNSIVRTAYSGNQVTVTDQINKQRKSVTDALGRLKQIYEDPFGVNYQTSYGYDALDNLLTVSQGTQTRTFAYDSLQRLTSATNPESGTIAYQYDNNGNLTQKTDARSIVTTYAYDALNRNTTVNYSDTATNPDITRTYDTATNGKGRLRESYAGGAETVGANVEHTKIVSYDALGRPLDQRQRFKTNSVWSAEFQTQRGYNLAGGVTSQIYPSGRMVSYAYDNAGRLNSFIGNLGDGVNRNYSTEIVYSPLGGMTKEKFGTDTPLYNKSFYNSRGQLSEIRVGTSYTGPTDTGWQRGAIINHYSNQCWGACNGSDNNGNLKQQDHFIPDSSGGVQAVFAQAYTYDNLNRLLRVNEGSNWQQEFVYDAHGNRTIHQTNTWGALINKKDFTVNTANNRLGVPGGQSGVMSYDAAGNLTNDTYTGAGSRVFDAENRMTKAWGGNNQWQEYTYNADGQRVRRKIDGIETRQIYGFDGELLAEYAANAGLASPEKEYGYRNGQLLVTAEPSRANVALAANGGTASASSYLGPPYNLYPSYVNDGARTSINGGIWLDGTISTFPDWIQVDFNGSKTIDEIDVITQQDNYQNPIEPTLTQTFSSYGITAFDVQYWNGSAWTTVPNGSVTGNNKVWRQFTFAPITTSKIRVVVNAGADNAYSRVVEVEAWEAAPVNYALAANGGTATGSSTLSPYVAGHVVDGARRGINGTGWLDNTNASFPDWIEVSFNGSKTISEIDVVTQQDNPQNPVEPTLTQTFSLYGITAFDVQYWNGSSWVTVTGGSVSGNNKVWRQFTFSPITTTKIRVVVNGGADNTYSRVVEVEAWNTPSVPSSVNINWLVADQLGTPRMIFDKTGSLATTKRHDYLPFGEELFAGVGGRTTALGYTGDTLRQQFTSKERDVETGLDYFGRRYYGAIQGRFTSTDPKPVTKESFLNPQRWSLYVYVNNSPLTAIDPNGGNGQGKGGDKVISVFLDYSVKDLGRRVTTDSRTGKEMSNVPNTSDWQGTKAGAPKGVKVELYGSSEVTGNKGFPQTVSSTAYENALKNSDAVIYVGHGRGDPGRVPFQQEGIQVGSTYYSSTGTGPAFPTAIAGPGPFTGPKPDVTASVVVNLSCDASRNGGAYYNFVGENQVMVTLNSRGDGLDGGVTSYDALDKAANAFVKAYADTGDVQKAVNAANSVLKNIPGNQNQNVGDEIKIESAN